MDKLIVYLLNGKYYSAMGTGTDLFIHTKMAESQMQYAKWKKKSHSYNYMLYDFLEMTS